MYETPTEIEQTGWAREFKQNCSWEYDEAIRLASDPDLTVTIQPSTETGPLVFAIIPEANPEFWLKAFDTPRKAVQFCYSMGWRIQS